MTSDQDFERETTTKWVDQLRNQLQRAMQSEAELITFLKQYAPQSILVEGSPHLEGATPAQAVSFLKQFFSTINNPRIVDRPIFKKEVKILLFIERGSDNSWAVRLIFLVQGIQKHNADLLWDLLWQEFGRAAVFPQFKAKELGARLFHAKVNGRLIRFFPLEIVRKRIALPKKSVKNNFGNWGELWEAPFK